jgi:hypothetical protein
MDETQKKELQRLLFNLINAISSVMSQAPQNIQTGYLISELLGQLSVLTSRLAESTAQPDQEFIARLESAMSQIKKLRSLINPSDAVEPMRTMLQIQQYADEVLALKAKLNYRSRHSGAGFVGAAASRRRTDRLLAQPLGQGGTVNSGGTHPSVS